MEVTLAVLADYSNVSKEGKLNILGIFNVINIRNFPAVHPYMQLVMVFEAPPAEAEITKSVQVKLMDADGRRILEVGGDFKVPKAKSGESVKMNHIINFQNVRFERAGDYQFSILIGGDTKKIVPLRVVKLQ